MQNAKFIEKESKIHNVAELNPGQNANKEHDVNMQSERNVNFAEKRKTLQLINDNFYEIYSVYFVYLFWRDVYMFFYYVSHYPYFLLCQ